MTFDEWWEAQNLQDAFDGGYLDEKEIAERAWAEAFKQATELAAVICESNRIVPLDGATNWHLANLIRQQGEDV